MEIEESRSVRELRREATDAEREVRDWDCADIVAVGVGIHGMKYMLFNRCALQERACDALMRCLWLRELLVMIPKGSDALGKGGVANVNKTVEDAILECHVTISRVSLLPIPGRISINPLPTFIPTSKELNAHPFKGKPSELQVKTRSY